MFNSKNCFRKFKGVNKFVFIVFLIIFILSSISTAYASEEVYNQCGMTYSGKIVGVPLSENVYLKDYGEATAFHGAVYDGENIWMIPYGADCVIKINKTTGQMTKYNNWPEGVDPNYNLKFRGGVYDGENVWMIPTTLNKVVKINASTGEMTAYDSWPGGIDGNCYDKFSGGIYDGENIWMIPNNVNKLVKINKTTGQMTAYNNWPEGVTLENMKFYGGVYDGENIWMIPCDSEKVVKMNVNTGEMTAYDNWPTGFNGSGFQKFYGGVYDGENIWMIPRNADSIIKMNVNTGEMAAYNNWPEGVTTGNLAFAGGVYDGKNIWMIPYNSTQIVKINKTTGEMTAYDNWPEGFTKGNLAFYGGVYDGQGIWMIPKGANHIIKIGSNCTVTFDKNGGDTEVSPDKKSLETGEKIGEMPVAPTRDGYSFMSWNTKADGSGIEITEATVLTSDITAYAQWEVNSGHSSKHHTASSETITPPTNHIQESIQSGIIPTEINLDSAGKAKASVTESEIKEAINQALTENKQSGATVTVKIKAADSDQVKTAEITIPHPAVNDLVANNIGKFTLSTPVAEITFDKDAITNISKKATGDVIIKAEKVDKNTLSDSEKQAAGDRPVYNFSVTSGNKTISQFGGNVTVTIPYILQQGEDANNIVIYYVNEEGKLEVIGNCVYNAEKQIVTFVTDHFSNYMIGYNKLNFKDVKETSQYAAAINFTSARGIIQGTGNNSFTPEGKLTRGQFLVMVMRTYGISPEGNPADNFEDAGNTYYTGYIAAAKRLGITDGIGNNMFAPNNAITRQEMLTMLYNTLKKIDKLQESTTGKDISAYSDVNEIASWAKESMTEFVKLGVVTGNGDELSPTAITTRAQMVQVLYNLMNK